MKKTNFLEKKDIDDVFFSDSPPDDFLQNSLSELKKAFLDNYNETYIFEAFLQMMSKLSDRNYEVEWLLLPMMEKFNGTINKEIESLLIGHTVDFFTIKNSKNKSIEFIASWFNISKTKARDAYYYHSKLVRDPGNGIKQYSLKVAMNKFPYFLNKMSEKLPRRYRHMKDKYQQFAADYKMIMQDGPLYDEDLMCSNDIMVDIIIRKLGFTSN